jgi:type IX secretion system PorP/SprF family membrane protein
MEDNLIPKTDVVGMSLDLGLGLLYSSPLYYAGLSYLHFNKPHIVWETSELTLPGCLYMTGGYNYILPDSKYVLKPSALLKSDFSTFQLDVSSRLEYENKYWGGLSFRYQDAIIFFAGINLAGGLSIGYSYDFPISQMIKVSSGSHEVLLNYSFEYIPGKRSTKYKSIRIL